MFAGALVGWLGLIPLIKFIGGGLANPLFPSTVPIAKILAGTVVCVATAIAGGTAQSLKTSFIIGGTPKKLQIGMFIGTVFSAAAIGGIILLLNNVYGIGSKVVSAPQATMMSMVVKGIMSGDLPWTLIWVGVALGVMCELMKIPVLPFALGLYLPIHLSAGVVIGGLVRVAVDHKFKDKVLQLKEQTEKGILLCSGLVAGEALIGILIAIFAFLFDKYAIFHHDKPVEKFMRWLIKKPYTSDIELDTMGSRVWELINGQNTVYDIGEQLVKLYGKNCEPVYDRLIMYIRYLIKKGWISFDRGNQDKEN